MMSLNELLKSIADQPERSREVPSPPPLETVAFFVRWSRALKSWKVSTLADYAGVSVSTVERVERGERVSVENLDRIAVALGYEAGKLHTPRIPLGPDKAAEDLIETYGYLEQVSVVPLKTQKAIRDAAKCVGILVHKPDVPDDHDDDIANLAEWIDLAGFILSEEIERDRQKSERRRLYNDIHKHVAEMERQGLTVLIGIMDAPQPQFPDAQVAILAITTKAADPGAVKREHIWVDRRNVSNLRFEVADEDT
ncbi:XRE family transcriptional regulator [Rhizobium ruizarguesonis]|jgi:transcriptional regulator with XRE-family HTH domain|nr:XRE family transcriptional regulator [Rhizobium ruizarguesonis]